MVGARLGAQKLALDAKARAARRQPPPARRWRTAKLLKILAKAEVRITAARDQAMTHVRDIASETAQAIVAQLTGAMASAAEVGVGPDRPGLGDRDGYCCRKPNSGSRSAW